MKLDYEHHLYSKKIKYICGTDEAGRGPLLGPVFAAAVILPKDFYDERINDSKKLTEKQRNEAYQVIIENAISYAICSCSVEEIDKLNILEASRLAMLRAVKALKVRPDFILSDCMDLTKSGIPFESLVKGDARSINIAAASILAKVSRDRVCLELDKKYPMYHIASNKGYGTKNHLEALDKYGPVKGLHRFSYKPVKASLYKKIKLF